MTNLISTEDFSNALKLNKVKLKVLAPALMTLLKLNKVNKLYAQLNTNNAVEFIEKILELLNISFEVDEHELKNIPATGAFIAVSNHPYGGIDGLILTLLMLRQRPDSKIVANYLLNNIEPLKEHIISVNPFEQFGNSKISVSGIKNLLNHLAHEKPTAIFPAGEVSALKLNKFKISDKPWSNHIAKIAKKSQVPVLPVYFAGHNSIAFNLLGLLNPQLRTLKLPSELFNKKQTIKVKIGKPISPKNYNQQKDLTKYFRAKTYALSSGLVQPKPLEKTFQRLKYLKKPKPIVSAAPHELLLSEITLLEKNNKCIYNYGNFKIFIASAPEMPTILHEIGRLREITFRNVGEGTNRKIDLDEFDEFYLHLFVWDTIENAIVGSYRIGEGDRIYRAFGRKGFYLSQLFKIKKSFSPILFTSIELGRSFVAINYQKKPLSLMLLWKGIHEYLKLNQHRFKYMIGPVSISNSYTQLSKELMVAHLNKFYAAGEFKAWVEPKKKFKIKSKGEIKNFIKLTENSDLKQLDLQIAEIEKDHSRMPVLLKKYIKLGGKFVTFNIDPKFNNSLDAFLVVKINEIPEDAFQLVDR